MMMLRTKTGKHKRLDKVHAADLLAVFRSFLKPWSGHTRRLYIDGIEHHADYRIGFTCGRRRPHTTAANKEWNSYLDAMDAICEGRA